MHVGKRNPNYSYVTPGSVLGVTAQEKDLGVIVEDTLKPSAQCVTAAKKKVNRKLGNIRKGTENKDENVLMPLYRSMPCSICHLLSPRKKIRLATMNEVCRVCSVHLRGNQRRWIFSQGGRASLRVLLSHALGQEVARDGHGEFLCGKCVHILERVYRFDTVISRVQALSIERLQRLLTEKDRLASWVRQEHSRRHPVPASAGYSGQDITVDIAGLPHVRYNALLQEDMALSEYESWSEQGGGKCQDRECRGKDCFGCSAFRVDDADFEAVCGIPRRLRGLQPGTLSRLSRNKSRSMPLDGLLSPGSPRLAYLGGGSCRSPGSFSFSSMSISNLSLNTAPDSEGDPFEDLPISPRVLAEALTCVKGIEYRPVRTPPRCKIPVRSPHVRSPRFPRSPIGQQELRGGKRSHSGDFQTGGGSQGRIHNDDFSARGGSQSDEALLQLLSDFPDEYLTFSPERLKRFRRVQQAFEQLKGELEEAQAELRTLKEAVPKSGSAGEEMGETRELSLPERHRENTTQQRDQLIQCLTESLHRKEEVLQDCLGLLRSVKPGSNLTPEPREALVEKLRLRLKDRDRALEQASEKNFASLQRKEEKMTQLHQALREKDRDLARLADVLRKNEEMINALRDLLQQKDFSFQQLEASQTTTLKREEMLVYALREKDAMISSLQEALTSSNRDVEALAESLIGQGLGGSDPTSPSSQLQEKGRLLLQAQGDLRQHSLEHQEKVEKLLKTLTDKEVLLKEQHQRFIETLASKSEEAQELRRRLLAKERELAECRLQERESAQEWRTQVSHLQASVEERDGAVQKLLQEGQEKDRAIGKLQNHFRESLHLGVGMKQTL
uniref:Uncharacterized protein LOC117346510 isoform X2 n=1 Tax=Geotrypetes seraphini TaxID=260995 RepID=A0A6P8PB04_GEOSA|nr:uncharacterized protein LOC117346510 isoform X2 [Geotrypetes seraphini]